MLTNREEQMLRHMLGADSRYKKKDWGFRNHYCASAGGRDDDELQLMKEKGLVTRRGPRDGVIFYHAALKGAKAIGFKSYQTNKTKGLKGA